MTRSEVALQGLSTVGHGGATRSDWLRSWVVALLVGVVAAVGCVAALRTLPGGTSRPTTTTRHGLASFPLAPSLGWRAADGRIEEWPYPWESSAPREVEMARSSPLVVRQAVAQIPELGGDHPEEEVRPVVQRLRRAN